MKFDSNTKVDYEARNSKLSEYLLIILPDSVIINKLLEFQEELSEYYGKDLEALPIRHILLANMAAKDSMEETISRWIMKVCRMQNSFPLAFNPVCVYNQGVLSLEVKESPALDSFNSRLHVADDFIRASGCLPLQIVSGPHLPLAILKNFSHIQAQKESVPSFTSLLQLKEVAMLKRNEPWESFERIDIFGLSS